MCIGHKGAITSKIKHAIKHKTTPARLAQLLRPSLAGRYAVIGCKLKQNARAATVVQVLQELFYVLHVLFHL